MTGAEIDPDRVTERVGLEPTKVVRVGERPTPRLEPSTRGQWTLDEEGPTAFNAPFVPQALVQTLLDRTRDKVDAFAEFRDTRAVYVSFIFYLPRFLRFSFELSPEVTGRLTALARAAAFQLWDVTTTQPLLHFGSAERARDHERCSACFAMTGPDLDPSEVTRLLEVEPTYAHRVGDPLGEREKKPATNGCWRIEATESPPTKGADVAWNVLQRLPPADSDVWAKLRAEGNTFRLFFSFFVDGQIGGFLLDHDVLEVASQIGATLDFLFLNEGA